MWNFVNKLKNKTHFFKIKNQIICGKIFLIYFQFLLSKKCVIIVESFLGFRNLR